MTWTHTLRQARIQKGLTLEALAKDLRVPYEELSGWEDGSRTPTSLQLAKLCHLLGIDPVKACSTPAPAAPPLPVYPLLHIWEKYSSDLDIEYQQCLEEGLAVEPYESLYTAVQQMPDNLYRDTIADTLYHIAASLPMKEGHPYCEPSDYEAICRERDGYIPPSVYPGEEELRGRVAGAWYGRIAGCLLGKPLEGIMREELLPFLKESGNYPMHRYVLDTDVTEERACKYRFDLRGRCYADVICQAPVDDDTNYTVLYQKLIDTYSFSFTPYDVAQAWMYWQPKEAYCTAERVAFCNFVKGIFPPASAEYKNHYREWVGAQIRGDYFGYINPGAPEKAAEMAWRDACISHTKNGIYGEMFIASLLACAACCTDMPSVIRGGLSQIPAKSRLYEKISAIVRDFEQGVSEEEAFRKITDRYDDHKSHDWCHTISNACIVAAALLYGGGDFGRSICLAVQTGFDTDCNGATVGSIVGMMYGINNIDPCWTAPFRETLETSIFGVGTVHIPDLIETTMRHIAQNSSH